jgi:hypothetical protein
MGKRTLSIEGIYTGLRFPNFWSPSEVVISNFSSKLTVPRRKVFFYEAFLFLVGKVFQCPTLGLR